jgi:hypothetical protein
MRTFDASSSNNSLRAAWPSLLSALASALRCRISDLLAPLDTPLPDVKFRPRQSAATGSG